MAYALAAAVLAGGAARTALAFEVPGDSPVELRGRFQTFVQVDRSSAPFPWDYSSSSPVDRTRLMLDLRAGSERYGNVYVKGAGTWQFSDDPSSLARFSFAQGDYLWARSRDAWALDARLYANERRYYTSEAGARLLDDDIVARYDTHFGARVDGEAGRFRWRLLGAGLEDAADGTRAVGWANAGWFARHVQASVGYLHDAPAADSLGDGGVIKGEVSAFVRGASAVVSFEQYGVDGDFSGSFDSNGRGYSGAMPDNSATFAEVRARDVLLGKSFGASAWARYRAVGERYRNDLSPDTPATTRSSAGVYAWHERYALDARLFYRREVRHAFADTRVDRVELHTRAFLQRGYEAFLRGGVGHRYVGGGDSVDENYAHAALRRRRRKFLGGLHAWVGNNEIGRVVVRGAAELRVNLGARSALYGRLITSQEATSNDAIYVRYELRPLTHVYATIAYGRSYIGDAPYILEDTDIGRTGPADNVYTFTVRGDF